MSADGEFVPHSDVGLADILLAVASLDEGQRGQAYAWIPDLLGIRLPLAAELAETLAGTESGGPDSPSMPSNSELERERRNLELRQRLRERRRPKKPPVEPDITPDAQSDSTLPTRLTPMAAPSGESGPQWLQRASDLAPAKPFSFDDLPALQPLFDPQRCRSVLSCALSTGQPDGDLDIGAILERVTQLQPLTNLPRENVLTTRLGLQLLIDGGPGLLPYAGDQELLLGDTRKVVGRDRVHALRFAISPLRGTGTGPRIDWDRPYAPPQAGTPVVVLTDLGIARRHNGRVGAPASEWLQFARQVRSAGCPVLAIVPYGRARVPRKLLRAFHVLPWSRSTTASTVRSLVGRGLRL